MPFLTALVACRLSSPGFEPTAIYNHAHSTNFAVDSTIFSITDSAILKSHDLLFTLLLCTSLAILPLPFITKTNSNNTSRNGLSHLLLINQKFFQTFQ